MSFQNKIINNRKRNVTKSSILSNHKKDENSKSSKEDSNSNKSETNSENNSKSDSDSENDSNSESKDNSEKSSSSEIHDSFEEGSQDSLNDDEEYNKLKEESDKANNFIDYFLVIGVEPEIYKKDWLFENDLDELNKKHKEELEPKIISSFPPFEKHTISFDESILMHCYPNGYQLIKSSSQPKPVVFSFILDNNYYNLNYPQKYLTCLICYENIVQYKLLKEQEKIFCSEEDKEEDKKNNKFNISSKNSLNIALDSIKDPEIYIPKCLLIMSLCPYFGEFEKILMEIYNYSLGIIPSNENSKVQERVRSSKILNNKKDIYDPIDKIIENLLIELPVPPRGFTTLEYSLNNRKRVIKQNRMNELPIININLKKIFLDFPVKDIITIYNYLFLEGRLLFFSKDIEILNLYIFGFLSLLYPFQYQ